MVDGRVLIGELQLLSDLRGAGARASWGVHAFSVFEVPDHDFDELARLEPILLSRPKMLEASGPELLTAGFPLLPTAKYPHWSVVLSEPTAAQFTKVRANFHGPFDNPTWTGRRS